MHPILLKQMNSMQYGHRNGFILLFLRGGGIDIDLIALYELVGENEIRRIISPLYFDENPSKEYLANEYLSHIVENLVRDGKKCRPGNTLSPDI